MSDSASNLSRDNIVRDAATASKRPDGTWRKAIKVKEGYIPQEEVPIYEPKVTQIAKQKERIKKGIPGAVFVDDLEKEPTTKKTVRNTIDTTKLNKMMNEIKISSKITGEQIDADSKIKQIRKLRKTLREIEQIEEKIKTNQNPEKEQLEKIKKKESILNELKELGEEID